MIMNAKPKDDKNWKSSKKSFLSRYKQTLSKSYKTGNLDVNAIKQDLYDSGITRIIAYSKVRVNSQSAPAPEISNKLRTNNLEGLNAVSRGNPFSRFCMKLYQMAVARRYVNNIGETGEVNPSFEEATRLNLIRKPKHYLNKLAVSYGNLRLQSYLSKMK